MCSPTVQVRTMAICWLTAGRTDARQIAESHLWHSTPVNFGAWKYFTVSGDTNGSYWTQPFLLADDDTMLNY